MLRALRRWVAQLLGRRPGAEGVPPVGVRAPRTVGPRGRSGAVAVIEPPEPTSVSALGGSSGRRRS